MVDVVSKINTGGSSARDIPCQSVGQNGVGVKPSTFRPVFEVQSFHDGSSSLGAVFFAREARGRSELDTPDEPNGTLVRFTPSTDIFGAYQSSTTISCFRCFPKNYTYLNPGLRIVFNGKGHDRATASSTSSEDNMTRSLPLYPVMSITASCSASEIAVTPHQISTATSITTFVNGTHTWTGGTYRLKPFKEAVCRTIHDFYGQRIRVFRHPETGMVAVSIGVVSSHLRLLKKNTPQPTEMGDDRGTIAK